LIELRKTEILKMGLELSAPLSLIYSCYEGEEKMCGECMSCLHLKDALSELSEADELGARFHEALDGRFIK
jgi:7-cyano-7-deazaguanine synthase